MMAGLGIILLITSIKAHPDHNELKWAVGMLTFFSFLTVFFVNYNFSLFSYDSYTMIFLGQQIGSAQALNAAMTSTLASWGVFIPLMHASAHFLQIDYLHAFQPIFAISGLVTIIYQIYLSLDKSTSNSVKILICTLATATLLSSYFIIFQSVYIHTNLTAAIYLFLFVSLFWRSFQQESPGNFYLGLIALLGFVFSRTETVLGAAIFLFLSFSMITNTPDRNKKILGLLLFSLIIFTWYLYLFVNIDYDSPILTPERIILLLLPYVMLITIILLPKNRIIDSLSYHAPKIMLF
ncbi:MAG: hypothetical protein OQL19_08030, partial [Gammaproteobacteria bacterium]|nr:hypothetical protein [Gammaproteobacteria bacterium]